MVVIVVNFEVVVVMNIFVVVVCADLVVVVVDVEVLIRGVVLVGFFFNNFYFYFRDFVRETTKKSFVAVSLKWGGGAKI